MEKNQLFYIYDEVFYNDFKVVILKCIKNDGQIFYEVRPVEFNSPINKLIPQEELENDC